MSLFSHHEFCKEFIFAFFASQERFIKINFTLLSTCKASEPRFNLAYFKLSSCPNSNRSLSASVLWRLLLKPSYTSTDQWTGWQHKAKNESNCSTNVLGSRLLFLPHCNLCKQSLTFAQLLAVQLTNSQVLDSPTMKIRTAEFLKTEFWPVS